MDLKIRLSTANVSNACYFVEINLYILRGLSVTTLTRRGGWAALEMSMICRFSICNSKGIPLPMSTGGTGR